MSRGVLGRVTRGTAAAAGALTLVCCVAPALANSSRPGATASRGCAYANTPVGRASTGELRSAVVCLIDGFRGQAGLPSLREQGQLDAAAQGHTDQMVYERFFGHGGIPASSPALRISAAGFRWGAYGEAISTGFRTPLLAVLAWLRSTEHCQILLSPEYRNVGLGVNPRPVAGWANRPGTWTADLALPLGRRPPSGNWGPASHCPY